MTFQIHPLPRETFEGLFGLSDADLAARGVRRVTVGTTPGFPCRVSMADADAGETVLLLNYTHQPNDGPYRASHAIYVREGAETAVIRPGDVPEVLRSRLISVRAFEADHLMVEADVVEGSGLAEVLERVFGNAKVAYIHLHNAKPGCFAASVTRV